MNSTCTYGTTLLVSKVVWPASLPRHCPVWNWSSIQTSYYLIWIVSLHIAAIFPAVRQIPLSLSLSLRCNISQTTLDNRHLCLHCWMLAVCQLGTSGQNTNMTLQTSPTVISLVCLLHNSCYNIWQKKEEEAKSSDNRGQSYFTTRLVVGYVGKQLPSSNISIWRC